MLYETTANGRIVLHAMPLLLAALCVIAIAYRYYSAFLAAKVAALDDSRETPAHRFHDGQNYHPTNRWVLFGHHFAAISGAGPLIGPVLAIQYGYMPGLLWLVIGVCLAGAVQDMLVLAASVRRGGKSLAEIARTELGKPAAIVVSAAILFIVIIALAGLGFVVVKALGGETVKLPKGMRVVLPNGAGTIPQPEAAGVHQIPGGAKLFYPGQPEASERSEAFLVKFPGEPAIVDGALTIPEGAEQLVPGSSWGTFTIACTIPIALFVGLYMYRIRKGHVVEASLIGAAAVLAVTVLGASVPGSSIEKYFSLSREQTIFAICAYGFVASVLPVWLLLCPRDYLSSFLKIGTIILLVVGMFVANPTLPSPALNPVFSGPKGGPTFPGSIFPFVFICIMCGAISGFHALVSSGTTPKMIDKESHIRMIGYGSMLMEGVVGLVALLAAASLPPDLYYDINIDLSKAGAYQEQLQELYRDLGETPEARDPMHQTQAESVQHLKLAQIEELVGGESLRGRTGGAVTLAVGMALVFTKALAWTALPIGMVMKYWYHFAIMFEALFILTTIDTGTRIARFLLQEAMGVFHPKFAQTDWLPGSLLATATVTSAWGALIYTGSINTIWPMFGIANQLLAVVALALVTTLLVNSGRGRYAAVTILPMLFVITTTMTAGVEMVGYQFPARMAAGRDLIARGQESAGNSLVLSGALSIGFAVFVMACVGALLLMAVSRWIAVLGGFVEPRSSSEN